jgi:acetyl esterase/lipase
VPDSVPRTAPPAFLIVADKDACCSGPVVSLLNRYRQSGASVEAHIIAHGDHAFNMGYRSNLESLKTWPTLLKYWLEDSQLAASPK